MRIVQVIDSLEVGGAERMAVNFANALAGNTDFSGLVVTRAEGNLKAHIDPNVGYVFLRRRSTMDFRAIFALRRYCIENRIDLMHAHSSSYFIATMVKILLPRIKVIWHDHNGMSEFLRSRESLVIKAASLFFKGIIVVNHQLKQWATRELYCRQVIYLANFTHRDLTAPAGEPLLGQQGKRILCLANLREQKNHLMLLEVAELMREHYLDWTFHLVGKDFEDGYSAGIREVIDQKSLRETVFIYGTRDDIAAVINQSDITILTSKSEGLPVALLEFGLHKKAVVVTAVGEIPEIISNGVNGFMVASGDSRAFYGALVQLVENSELRERFGLSLYDTIRESNSEEAVIAKYLTWLQTIT